MVVGASSVNKLNKTKAIIWVGESVKLKVIDNSKSIEWQSSNPKVATVNDSGTVRGKGAGKAVVSAKIGKKKYNCLVKVKDTKIKSVKAKNNTQKDNTQLSFVFSDNSVIKKTVNYSIWGLAGDEIIEHYEFVDLTGDGRKEVGVYRNYPNNLTDWRLVNVFLMKDGKLKELSYEKDILEVKGQPYDGNVISLNKKGYPKYGLELELYGRDENGDMCVEHKYIIGYKNNKWSKIKGY